MDLFTHKDLQILPIAYQSYDTAFSDWITLFTLCLAPLIAHVIAGVPRLSYLYSHRPKWHQRVCLYNPTTILWRYAVITDRRIRAISWDKADMAAANTLFWTAKGWDGSEAMVDLSLPYCSHLPEHARISVFSREMFKTVIVTFQGIQAIILLTSVFASNTLFTGWMGVDIIFFPLAFIGLLRLSCGLWLTDDFAYSGPRAADLDQHQHDPPPSGPDATRQPLDGFLERPSSPRMGNGSRSRYREAHLWSSIIFRALFLLPILGMWTIAILYLIVSFVLTATAFLTLIFYFVLLGGTTVICSFYFIRGPTTTTVIPCISSAWYRVYSGIIMALALVILTVACIETRRTPCGEYTSGPPYVGDYDACFTADSDVIFSGGPDSGSFGLATTSINHTTAKPGQYWVFNFTGTCLGRPLWSSAQLVMVEPSI